MTDTEAVIAKLREAAFGWSEWDPETTRRAVPLSTAEQIISDAIGEAEGERSETGDILRFIAEHAFDSRPERDQAERIDINLWRGGRFHVHVHRTPNGDDEPETVLENLNPSERSSIRGLPRQEHQEQ